MDNNAAICITNSTITVKDDSDNDEVTDFLNSNCSSNTQSLTSTTISIPTATTSAPCFTTSESDTLIPTTVTTTTTGTIENCENKKEENYNITSASNTVESQNYCIPVINTTLTNNQHSSRQLSSADNNNSKNNKNNLTPLSSSSSATKYDNNMIPIINVTPHSPANVSKYNNIFEDTLSQLHIIRESVVQMKNSSSHTNDGLTNYGYGLVNAAILSASLPDLSTTGNGVAGTTGTAGAYGPLTSHFLMWSPQQQQQYLLNADRRKSWTGIDDLSAGGDCTNKSVSLSSLDSEEQETIRVTEQRRRSARNSTG
ncbi:hypothetical protein DOY81_011319, partial [Sarcophaga bullata]